MNFFQWIKNRFKRDEFGLRYIKRNPFKDKNPKPPSSKIGITRKNKKQSKAHRKMAKESRRINHKRAK